MNPLHNVIHLVLAVALAGLPPRATAPRGWPTSSSASCSGLVTVLGFVGGMGMLGMSGLADPDNFLHLATATLALYFGSVAAGGAAARPPDRAAGGPGSRPRRRQHGRNTPARHAARSSPSRNKAAPRRKQDDGTVNANADPSSGTAIRLPPTPSGGCRGTPATPPGSSPARRSVLLMTPGLALFYGGMVRAKSVLNMMMMSFGALALISVLWVLYGYSVAFGNDVGGGLVGNPFEFFGLKLSALRASTGFASDVAGLHDPGHGLRRPSRRSSRSSPSR